MASSSPCTVEEIFKDYSARRSALVRALTYDVDDFYSQCDPGGRAAKAIVVAVLTLLKDAHRIT
ncbi:Alfin [Theobroma cacao]|nr:Alfin [Theobroma cacao]